MQCVCAPFNSVDTAAPFCYCLNLLCRCWFSRVKTVIRRHSPTTVPALTRPSVYRAIMALLAICPKIFAYRFCIWHCFCQALADGLSKGRHYVFPDGQGSTALDPRLLLVEFNSSILLHQAQVNLFRCESRVGNSDHRQFRSSFLDGRSCPGFFSWPTQLVLLRSTCMTFSWSPNGSLSEELGWLTTTRLYDDAVHLRATSVLLLHAAMGQTLPLSCLTRSRVKLCSSRAAMSNLAFSLFHVLLCPSQPRYFFPSLSIRWR